MINNRPFSYSDWTLVAPIDVPIQADSFNCGVYACISALCLVNLRMYPISHADMNLLRYFIVHKAINCPPSEPFGMKKESSLQLEKPVFTSRKIDRQLVVKNSTNTYESLCILVMGAGNDDTTTGSYAVSDDDELFKEELDLSILDEKSDDEISTKSPEYETKAPTPLLTSDRLIQDAADNDHLDRESSQRVTGKLTAAFEKLTEAMKSFDNSSDSSCSNHEDDYVVETDGKTRGQFLESFVKNKEYMVDFLKCFENLEDKSRAVSERLLALRTLDKKEYIRCAQKELEVFKNRHGTETLYVYTKHITYMFQTDSVGDPLARKGRWLGNIGQQFGLRTWEFYTLVVLQELITKAYKEINDCSYRQATMRMFSGSPYHIPVMKQVSYETFLAINFDKCFILLSFLNPSGRKQKHFFFDLKQT